MSHLHILLIDDDLVEHRFFRKFLEGGVNSDAELTCLSNLDEAIDILNERAFDLVFLDDRLSPYSSLLETLPRIRPYIGGAKIFAISSSLDSPHLMDARKTGVDEIYDKNDLKAVLSSSLPAAG